MENDTDFETRIDETFDGIQRELNWIRRILIGCLIVSLLSVAAVVATAAS